MVSVPLSLVSVDGDPVGEQLLQSSEGQVQRGSVPGAGGNHYRGTGKRCSVVLSPTELFFLLIYSKCNLLLINCLLQPMTAFF